MFRAGPLGSPVAASQSRAVLSSLPVMAVLPSGLNKTVRTVASCTRGGPIGLLVAAAQSCAVLSQLPVMIVVPSGLNATAVTDF